jgi:biopolymer transport protein ExbB
MRPFLKSSFTPLTLFLIFAPMLWAEEIPFKPEEKIVTLRQLIDAAGWYFVLPLVLLSMAAVTLVVYYFFALRPGRIVSRDFVMRAKRLLAGGDIAGLELLSRETGDLSSRVVGAAARALLDNPQTSHGVLREITESEGARQSTHMMQMISYLNDIAVISPLIGLLGTVVGLIRSFAVLSTDVGSARALMLAEGVSQALVNTAAGLLIAIPAMGFYAYFRGRVQRSISDLESVSTELVGRMNAKST